MFFIIDIITFCFFTIDIDSGIYVDGLNHKKVQFYEILGKFYKESLDNITSVAKKAEFSEGSGTKDFLEEAFEQCISDSELEMAEERILKEDSIHIRSKQELYFYRIFKTFYLAPSIANTVRHWSVA